MVKVTIEYEGETKEYTGDFAILKVMNEKEGNATTTAVGEAWPEEIIESMMKSEKVLLKEFAKEHYQEAKEMYQAYLEEEGEGMTC